MFWKSKVLHTSTKKLIPAVKHWGECIMMWDCYAASGFAIIKGPMNIYKKKNMYKENFIVECRCISRSYNSKEVGHTIRHWFIIQQYINNRVAHTEEKCVFKNGQVRVLTSISLKCSTMKQAIQITNPQKCKRTETDFLKKEWTKIEITASKRSFC